MSAKMMSSLTDENRHIQKQIGCMNGLLQLFDRRHFLTSRHNHKKLLLGAQQQKESHDATKAVIEREMERQKEKPRLSTESSSQTSYSSSSCSSTFSSLDHNRKSQQPQRPPKRQTSTSQSQFPIKEQQPSSTKVLKKSSDIRDLVKDSIHREARGVSIKSFSSDERKVTVMKHIDSPRPLHQSNLGKMKNSKDEQRLTLARFSYDGRESRDTFKTNMKLKELPRYSLDSRKSSSALETRLNFLHKENEYSRQVFPLNQESGGHSRSSSIVAKLMGLEDFPDTISTDENWITKTNSSPSAGANFLSKSSTRAEENKQKQVSVRKTTTCLKVPVEPAPWKQQEFCHRSPKTSLQSKKAPTNIPHPSSSVYGEIEKRITELEFKRSGKDLRALKQILEAMQKTRERLEENQSLDDGLTNQNSNMTVSGSSVGIVKFSGSTEPSQRKNPAHIVKAQDPVPRNNMKKSIWKNSEPERTVEAPQRMSVENCSTSGRGFRVSTSLQQNVLRIARESHPNTPSLESGRVRKHSCKKVTEKLHQNRKHKVKSMDLQLSDDQLSELSSDTRQSSYHGDIASIKSEVASDIETEVLGSINMNTREQENPASPPKEHMLAVELAGTMVEQPSPVSVLDTTFYSEDSPSPVKKISTPFRDESPSPDEAEWHVENLNQQTDISKYGPVDKYNQKTERMLHLIHEPRFSKTEDNETAGNHNGTVYLSLNPAHRYINKILQASGLLKDTMPTANQLLSSCPLIDPDLFHALEKTEEPLEEANGELIEENRQIKLNQKINKKNVFDAVNEMLVCKITPGRYFTLRRKRIGMQELIKEVYSEMDHLCRMPYCNLDGEDDGSIRLLTADMKYQSDEWIDQSGEVSALVLDVERQIFKDLINEVVTGEAASLRDWPKRHSRKLFN